MILFGSLKNIQSQHSWKLYISGLLLPLVVVGAFLLQSSVAHAALPPLTISSPACVASNYTGSGVSVSWTDTSVTNVQITDSSNFSNYVFTKGVAKGTVSTTAPTGFTFFGTALTLNPGTTYYVRTLTGSTAKVTSTFTLSSCNPVPAQPSVTIAPACIVPNYSGSGITVSWKDTFVTNIQISADKNFASYIFSKQVTPGTVSTTAPTGFTFFSTPLTLNPATTYYARVYNGGYSTSATITVSACNTTTTVSPACIVPNYSGSGITISWKDTTVSSLQISDDPTFSMFVFMKTVAAGTTTTNVPTGFTFFGTALTLNPGTTYYVRTATSTNVTLPGSSISIPSCNPTPAPPAVTLPACIDYGYSGSGITMSWTDKTIAMLQINNEPAFAGSSSYIFSKQVTPGTTTTTVPTGFTFFGTSLVFNPNIMYFARAYNGTYSASVGFYLHPCSSLPIPSTVPIPPANAKKIEIIGDSITQADTTRNSFRRPLWFKLTNAGLPVDFVGSLNMNYDFATTNPGHLGLPPNPDFDLDNDGHFGYTASTVLANIGLWAGISHPDYALVLIGSNDMANGRSPQSTVADIGGIIDGLRKVNPTVKIFLATVIPSTDPTRNSGVQQLNLLIPAMVSQKNSSTSPATLVDMNSGFDATADTVDGIHPNPAGEEIIATKWFNALQPSLSAQ